MTFVKFETALDLVHVLELITSIACLCYDAHSMWVGPQGESVGAFLADPLQFLKDCRAKYGGIVGLLLGGEYVVLLSEAAAARQVLIEQAGSVFVKVFS